MELSSIGNRMEQETACGSVPLPSAICKVCNKEKSLEEFFSYLSHGKPYTRRTCKRCDGKRSWKTEKNNAKRYADRRNKLNNRSKERRKDPALTAYFIVRDSTRSDRIANRTNNLTREFVEHAISHGCLYCGETSLRMTMDRIDNKNGHTTDNVVAACIRCNYIRRDMPYAAWYLMLPALRAAREQGLFTDWNNRVR